MPAAIKILHFNFREPWIQQQIGVWDRWLWRQSHNWRCCRPPKTCCARLQFIEIVANSLNAIGSQMSTVRRMLHCVALRTIFGRHCFFFFFCFVIHFSQPNYVPENNKVVQLNSIEPNWWRDRKLSTRWSLIVRKQPRHSINWPFALVFSYSSSFTSFIIYRAGARAIIKFYYTCATTIDFADAIEKEKKILRHRLIVGTICNVCGGKLRCCP